VPTGLKALTLRVAFAASHRAASGRIKSGSGLAFVIAGLDLAASRSRILGESLATSCRPGTLLAASRRPGLINLLDVLYRPGSAVLAISHS
jgi:hypothetical protein